LLNSRTSPITVAVSASWKFGRLPVKFVDRHALSFTPGESGTDGVVRSAVRRRGASDACEDGCHHHEFVAASKIILTLCVSRVLRKSISLKVQ
jgi:hypothetical protein